jgi:hypothetical protein
MDAEVVVTRERRPARLDRRGCGEPATRRADGRSTIVSVSRCWRRQQPFGLPRIYTRARQLRSAGVIRARLLGDARSTTGVACAGSDALQFEAGAGLTQIEYTASDGKLLRWLSTTDRQTPLADDVTDLECNDLGEQGLELELSLGGTEHPFHFYFHVSEYPEPEEEEEGGA